MSIPAWPRASKFREHLSFISTNHHQTHNLKSAFSPITPPPVPSLPSPEPAKRSSWSTWKQDSIDLERGAPSYHTKQDSRKSKHASLFSFWRSPSTPPPLPQLPPWPPLAPRKMEHHDPDHCPHCHDNQRKKKNNRKWLIILIVIILLLLANSVVLNVRSFSPSSPTTDLSNDSSTSTSAPSSPSTTPVSQVVLDCLSQFKLNAPSSPDSYPCSTCASILAGVPNDLSPSATNATLQTSGQGAVLQFCAMRDVATVTANSTLQNVGWLKDVSVCSWKGITCDSAGRMTSLSLVFPGVPATLPVSLSNLVGLQTIEIIGDSNIPAGTLMPNGLLSLPSLQSIHLETTGLAGPMPDDIFKSSANLTSLTLSRNAQLGQTLPSSLYNLSLSTLIVNAQSLVSPLDPILTSPSLSRSLQTLDLSTNGITASLPSSLSSLTSLRGLHLDSNQLNGNPPTEFPSTLSEFTMAGNANVNGDVPSGLCALSGLRNCDLRGTGVQLSSQGGCGVCQFGSTSQ